MAAVIAGCDTAVTQKGHAERVFINSRIYTGNIDQPWAEAIALEGKNIACVGDATGASSFVCDSSATIDLDGRLMMPGFVSTHEHSIFLSAITGGALIEVRQDRDYLLSDDHKVKGGNGNAWTIPLGLTVGRTLDMGGGHGFDLGVGAYGLPSGGRPKSGAKYQMKLGLSWIFPR